MKRNSAWIISRRAQREQRQATAREPLSTSSIIALWGKPITVQDALTTTLHHPHRGPSRLPSQVLWVPTSQTDVRRPSGTRPSTA
ncbi:MAG: hypothetical protein ACLU0O_02620 [Collinsella sp.]